MKTRDHLFANKLKRMHLFHSIDPTGTLALQTCAEIKNVHFGGGEPQIRAATHVLGCRFRAHTLHRWSSDYGENGPLHHLLYHNRVDPNAPPSHYDFLEQACQMDANFRNEEHRSLWAKAAAHSPSKEIHAVPDGNGFRPNGNLSFEAPSLATNGNNQDGEVVQKEAVMTSHTKGDDDQKDTSVPFFPTGVP